MKQITTSLPQRLEAFKLGIEKLPKPATRQLKKDEFL